MLTYILKAIDRGIVQVEYCFEEMNEALCAAITMATREQGLEITITQRSEDVLCSFTPPPQDDL